MNRRKKTDRVDEPEIKPKSEWERRNWESPPNPRGVNLGEWNTVYIVGVVPGYVVFRSKGGYPTLLSAKEFLWQYVPVQPPEQPIRKVGR